MDVLLGDNHETVQLYARELGYVRGSFIEVTPQRPARGLRPERVIVVGPLTRALDAPIDYFQHLGASIEYRREL